MVVVNVLCCVSNKFFLMDKQQAEIDKKINNINISPECFNINSYNINTDVDFFKVIDIPEKAYLLGLFYNTLHLNDSNSTVVINNIKREQDSYVIKLIKSFGDNISLNYHSTKSMFKLSFNVQPSILVDIKKHYSTKLFKYNDDKLKLAFIRGLYEGHKSNIIDHINFNYENLSEDVTKEILDFINIPYINNDKLKEAVYKGCNAIDFLGKIYKDSYDLCIKYYKNGSNYPNCKVYRTDESAVLPSKSRESDVGYDLTIIKEAKQFNKKTKLYDTGIKIELEDGYYAEIVPRSSISKSGYMLANNIGIIDNSYRGNLYIPLIKIDEDSPDIELPFKCCQLIIRKQIYLNIYEVEEELDETNRNQGGFGSTNT